MKISISVMMTRWKIQPLGHTFDAVIANPPYSAKWTADSKFENDERFSGYGKLAPKSKADFAFIQHMVHYLDDEGTMAVVLPHGVLFRGAEGVIRRYLIEEKNYLEAVMAYQRIFSMGQVFQHVF